MVFGSYEINTMIKNPENWVLRLVEDGPYLFNIENIKEKDRARYGWGKKLPKWCREAQIGEGEGLLIEKVEVDASGHFKLRGRVTKFESTLEKVYRGDHHFIEKDDGKLYVKIRFDIDRRYKYASYLNRTVSQEVETVLPENWEDIISKKDEYGFSTGSLFWKYKKFAQITKYGIEFDIYEMKFNQEKSLVYWEKDYTTRIDWACTPMEEREEIFPHLPEEIQKQFPLNAPIKKESSSSSRCSSSDCGAYAEDAGIYGWDLD